MLFSRNPSTGVIECYTDDGEYVGVMSSMGDTLEDDSDDGDVPTDDGGPGSGNFHHLGRPGHRGGSGGGGSSSKNSTNGKRGNQPPVENNNKEEHGSGGGGTNFRSADEFREYLTGSPKENVAATRAHIKDDAWIRQRDQAIANGDLPKSGFDRSERVVRDVVKNMLKNGKFSIIKTSFQDFRATLIDPRLKGTVYDYDEKGDIVAISSTTVRLSCSREKGYHVYPVKGGDVE